MAFAPSRSSSVRRPMMSSSQAQSRPTRVAAASSRVPSRRSTPSRPHSERGGTTRDLATSPVAGRRRSPSPHGRYLSVDVSTSPLSPTKTNLSHRSLHIRNSPSVKSSPGGSMLRASQMKSPSHKSPEKLSVVSPGSPTGKLIRTRKHNQELRDELQQLREAFEDIDDRNQALLGEKEQVSRRLQNVQEQLNQETEGFFEQSAYAKSAALQLQEEQQKVIKLKRAVDSMELDVQDLLAEKDTHIANLEGTIRRLEQEQYMVKTRLVQVEDVIVDERHRYAALERRNSDLEKELNTASCLIEKQKHMEQSKMESERSVVEFRKRNDDLMEESRRKEQRMAALEERLSTEGSSNGEMKSKISSLETAAQLQVKHLESILLQEAGLRKDLKISRDENATLEEQVQRITGHLSLAQSESRTKETVIHELSSKLQALEKENKDLRDKVSRADDTERQNLARVQQTLGGENESLKAQGAELKRAYEESSKELGETRLRLEAREAKYRSQRDLLARQSEVMRTLQDRCSHAEDELRRTKAECSATLDELTELRQDARQRREDIEELKAAVNTYKTKAAKGSQLNAKLLGLMSQVVTSDNDTMSEGLDQQLQSLALARVAAGS